MYGLSAIGAANGWSMAILGISIVFAGLITLSILISQLHKVLDFWENWEWINGKSDRNTDRNTPGTAAENSDVQLCSHPYFCPTEIDELTAVWEPLVNRLDTPFYLADLYELARKHNFPHPHLSINRLRSANILVPIGDRLFEWNTEANEEE